NAARLLTLASRATETDVRRQGLTLATAWLARPDHADAVSAASQLVRACLQDPEPANRTEAIRLAVHKDIGLGRFVAPLLNDPEPEVRQAALAAVGGPDAEEVVASDELLHSLHDSDATVRRLCEAALRSRGLGSNDLVLGRLITDANPGTRL